MMVKSLLGPLNLSTILTQVNPKPLPNPLNPHLPLLFHWKTLYTCHSLLSDDFKFLLITPPLPVTSFLISLSISLLQSSPSLCSLPFTLMLLLPPQIFTVTLFSPPHVGAAAVVALLLLWPWLISVGVIPLYLLLESSIFLCLLHSAPDYFFLYLVDMGGFE